MLTCLGLEVACNSPFAGVARSNARAARERSSEYGGWGKKGKAMADIRPGESFPPPLVASFVPLPACRRLLFPLLHAEKVPFPRAPKEIGDVCTQAIRSPAKRGSTEFEPRGNWVRFSERTFPANYTTVFLMCFEVKYRVVDGFSSRRNQQKK